MHNYLYKIPKKCFVMEHLVETVICNATDLKTLFNNYIEVSVKVQELFISIFFSLHKHPYLLSIKMNSYLTIRVGNRFIRKQNYNIIMQKLQCMRFLW